MMYRQSSLLLSSVRAPQTSEPRPGKVRMAFTASPCKGVLSPCCWASVISKVGAIRPLIPTLAGAFQTPRLLSVVVNSPAIAPLGGGRAGVWVAGGYVVRGWEVGRE